jgi:hypothetical protein
MSEAAKASQYDLVVLGSGGAALAAAVTAANEGLKVVVLERAELMGGTSAISGGALWIPGTRQAIAGGFKDSPDDARRYLRTILGKVYDSDLVDAFLTQGPQALAYLEDNTELKYTVRDLSPDYYPEIEGATDSGRALEVAEYDGRRLGDDFQRLRPMPPGMTLFGSLMLSRIDVRHFLNMRRSPASLLHCAKLVLRFGMDRLSYHRGTRLVIGNAMIAALLRSCIDKGVTFQLGAEVSSLVMGSDGSIQGVTATLGTGDRVRIKARGGVVLATGGLSRSAKVLQDRPETGEDHLSMAAPMADGTMISMAQGIGARIGGGLLANFYWAPMSKAVHADGRIEVFPHIVTDRARPGIIAVGDDGQRFTNEANSYHRFVEAMQARRQEGVSRFYLIADHAALHAYGLGLARPFPGRNRRLTTSGYLTVAPTLKALAQKLAINPAPLEATIAAFNISAAKGVDPAFHRGETSHNRAMGDAQAAHPNLAPLIKPPFYAIRLYTGDLGSAKGLATNGEAQVLRTDGSVIPGLYAAGSDMNSVMAGSYPGPGITLGPGLTFGYVAAIAALRRIRSEPHAPVL